MSASEMNHLISAVLGATIALMVAAIIRNTQSTDY
jgi:uncharacterized membrane protein YeaQ/YmgE (transglycosylase-associated protein family)